MRAWIHSDHSLCHPAAQCSFHSLKFSVACTDRYAYVCLCVQLRKPQWMGRSQMSYLGSKARAGRGKQHAGVITWFDCVPLTGTRYWKYAVKFVDPKCRRRIVATRATCVATSPTYTKICTARWSRTAFPWKLPPMLLKAKLVLALWRRYYLLLVPPSATSFTKRYAPYHYASSLHIVGEHAYLLNYFLSCLFRT